MTEQERAALYVRDAMLTGLRGRLETAARELAAECVSYGEVAEKLMSHGITGKPGCSGECPVAVYLTGKLDLRNGQFVSAGHVRLAVCDADGPLVMVDTPHMISQFMMAFDNGRFALLSVN